MLGTPLGPALASLSPPAGVLLKSGAILPVHLLVCRQGGGLGYGNFTAGEIAVCLRATANSINQLRHHEALRHDPSDTRQPLRHRDQRHGPLHRRRAHLPRHRQIHMLYRYDLLV